MSGSKRPKQPGRAARSFRTIVRGLLLLGRGRAEGFECFEGSRDAFLAGLSPPIGFLLVLSALLLLQRPTVAACCLVLTLFCAILLPPVISQAMARLWGRTEQWPRYATASLWSVWLVLPAYLPAMLLTAVLLQMGVSHELAGRVIVLLLGGYLLWLQWFMAWKGLGIGRVKAGLTVLALMAGSTLIGVAMQPLLPLVMEG
ncbi:hypothetical protein [Lichenicola sp.]|uniref:hypothetical protein n=1 Tax=Lichenicola sp. TaxID=2804529 RepID=UPI003AFF7285